MIENQQVTREVRLEPIVFRTGWRRWLWATAQLEELLIIIIVLGMILLLTIFEISAHQFTLSYFLIGGFSLAAVTVIVARTVPIVARRGDKWAYREWYSRMTDDNGPIGEVVNYWSTQYCYLYSAELRRDGTLAVVFRINDKDVSLVLKQDSYGVGVDDVPAIRSVQATCDLPASPRPEILANARAGAYATTTVTLFVEAELLRPAGQLFESVPTMLSL